MFHEILIVFQALVRIKMANIVSRLFSALVLYGVGLFWAGVTVPVAVSMALVRSKFNLNQVFGKKKRNNIPRSKCLKLN